MNISFNWLKEYVDLGNMTPNELDDLLTFSTPDRLVFNRICTLKDSWAKIK